jgi:hypothetical protein
MDKMSVADSRPNKDLVLPMSDARGLRDDISRLLSELYTLTKTKVQEKENEIVKVEISGGTFR